MLEYSPYLALGTGLFELAAAVWVLRGPGERRVIVPAGLMLFFLSGYQLSEAALCTLGDVPPDALVRLAWFDIAWLPPLGILLVAGLARSRVLGILGGVNLALSGVSAVGALFAPSLGGATVCEAVWARYLFEYDLFLNLYGGLYYVGMIGMIVSAAAVQGVLRGTWRRRAVAQAQVGFVLFLVPPLVFLNTFDLKGAAPSVLCHFALFLAIFLVRMVRIVHADAPEAAQEGTWSRA